MKQTFKKVMTNIMATVTVVVISSGIGILVLYALCAMLDIVYRLLTGV